MSSLSQRTDHIYIFDLLLSFFSPYTANNAILDIINVKVSNF